MVQCGSRLRFALETGQSGRVLGYLFGQKLERHKAVQASVLWWREAAEDSGSKRVGSKAMLSGSIASLGSQYVLTLNAISCQTGDSLAQEQAQAAVLAALGGAVVSLAILPFPANFLLDCARSHNDSPRG